MRGTLTKIVSLSTRASNATEEYIEIELNKALYELHVYDSSAKVINTQLYERNGSRYSMIVYETTSVPDPGNVPPPP
jgi:hypothetical protein